MATPLVSTGQTRVQSVSICPTNRKYCNGKCKSCIARMTPGDMKAKPEWAPKNRVIDTLDYGKQAGAMTAIMTSKSEPLLDYKDSPSAFESMVYEARKRLPQVDMHTNAVLLARHPEWLESLADAGLNMLTISLASFDTQTNRAFMGNWCKPFQVIQQANRLGIYVRMSVLLTKETVGDMAQFAEYVKAAREAGADAIVARELWKPNISEALTDDAREVYEWVDANRVDMAGFMQQFESAMQGEGEKGDYGLRIKYLRPLPWGMPIYSADDINLIFARCDEKAVDGVYKSIQLVPREYPSGQVGWRIQGSWGDKGDVLG